MALEALTIVCKATGVELKLAVDADPEIMLRVHENALNNKSTVIFATDGDFSALPM